MEGPRWCFHKTDYWIINLIYTFYFTKQFYKHDLFLIHKTILWSGEGIIYPNGFWLYKELIHWPKQLWNHKDNHLCVHHCENISLGPQHCKTQRLCQHVLCRLLVTGGKHTASNFTEGSELQKPDIKKHPQLFFPILFFLCLWEGWGITKGEMPARQRAGHGWREVASIPDDDFAQQCNTLCQEA